MPPNRTDPFATGRSRPSTPLVSSVLAVPVRQRPGISALVAAIAITFIVALGSPVTVNAGTSGNVDSTAAVSSVRQDDEDFYVRLIQTDGRLFGIEVARFSPTRDRTLLQQYYVSNLKKAPAGFGSFIEITNEYIEKRLPGARSDRIALAKSWLKDLKPGEKLDRAYLDRALLYLDTKQLALSRDKLDPSSPVVKEVTGLLRRLEKTDGKNGWTLFVMGLAAQALRLRCIEAGVDAPPLALIAKASLLAAQDGHLHYVIGGLYTEVLDRRDVETFVKLVTAEFEKCLLLQPSNRELFTRITGIYVEIHESYEAGDTVEPFWFEELVYKRIIALDPTNAQAHNNLSFLYSTLGINLKQALREARIANQLKPDDPYLLDTLGWAYYRNGMLADALKVLKRAVAAKPDLADIHFHLASVYYDLDEFKPTVRHFRETIRLDPKNAFAYNNLAYFLAEKNRDLPEALELVDKALTLNPGNAAFLDTKGWLLFKLGRTDEAVPYMKKALALSPETPELHLHLGQALLAMKDFGRAIQAFQHALAYDPNNRDIARKLSRLFVIDGLRRAMASYADIEGVRKEKENFRIFYDLMARAYMEDGDYAAAAGVLDEYRKLRPGMIPPRVSGNAAGVPAGEREKPGAGYGDGGAEARTMSGETRKKWAALARYLAPQSDFQLCLTEGALLKVLDVALEQYKTPLPAGILRGLVASRLPARITAGFRLARPIPPDSVVIVLEFPEHAMDFLSRRLSSLAGTEMSVPFAGVKVAFEQRRASGLTAGRIVLPFGSVCYLIPEPGIMVLCPDEATIDGLARQVASGTPRKGPGFLSSDEYMRFESRLDPQSDLFTFLAVPHDGRLDDVPLPEAYRKLLDGAGAMAASYRMTVGDVLVEETIVFPRPGVSVTALHGPVGIVAEDLKSKIAVATKAQVRCTSSFKDSGEGFLAGRIRMEGVKAWFIGILSLISTLDYPVDGGASTIPATPESTDGNGPVPPEGRPGSRTR